MTLIQILGSGFDFIQQLPLDDGLFCCVKFMFRRDITKDILTFLWRHGHGLVAYSPLGDTLVLNSICEEILLKNSLVGAGAHLHAVYERVVCHIALG